MVSVSYQSHLILAGHSLELLSAQQSTERHDLSDTEAHKESTLYQTGNAFVRGSEQSWVCICRPECSCIHGKPIACECSNTDGSMSEQTMSLDTDFTFMCQH